MRRCTTWLKVLLGTGAVVAAFHPSAARAGGDDPCADCAEPAGEPAHGEPPDGAAELEAFIGKLQSDVAHDGEQVDDAAASDPEPEPTRETRVISLDISDSELKSKIRNDPSDLGSMSVGRPQRGVLVNGRRFPKGEHWELVAPGSAYATEETIDYLVAAIERVQREHPGGHPLYIGDISAKRGGNLGGHHSHQNGRDVDISFYYENDEGRARWYRRATGDNLDTQRTWAFVRALLTETDVKFIFINTSVQKVLKEHALAAGEDPEWLDRVFEYDSKDPWPIIRHAPGHDTHIHVRFYNPQAQELGRRAYPYLVARGLIKPRVYYTHYTAKKGDILGRIANKFDTSVAKIQKANGLRGSKILAGETYRIPRKGNVDQLGKVKIPPRRLPPASGSATEHATAAGN